MAYDSVASGADGRLQPRSSRRYAETMEESRIGRQESFRAGQYRRAKSTGPAPTVHMPLRGMTKIAVWFAGSEPHSRRQRRWPLEAEGNSRFRSMQSSLALA